MIEKSHNEIWDKVVALEGDLKMLSVRLDETRNIVSLNQNEFKTRVSGLEETQEEILIRLAEHGAQYKVGTALLGFLITAGIAILAILR